MTIRYEVDADNVVKAFEGDPETCILHQPNWPNGDAWADAAEASAWAELWVKDITDPSAPYAPLARGESGKAKPTAEQMATLSELRRTFSAARTPEEFKAASDAIQQAIAAF